MKCTANIHETPSLRNGKLKTGVTSFRCEKHLNDWILEHPEYYILSFSVTQDDLGTLYTIYATCEEDRIKVYLHH